MTINHTGNGASGEPPAILAGGGEMAERIRGFDWASTPVGPVTTWSPALRITAQILLASPVPHILWWGPEHIQLYNDACRPILGAKHPGGALGRPASECWSALWHVLGPLIATPFHGGPATLDDDILLEIDRRGFVEETHFTIAYSPVPDETAPGGVGGVLATMHEITEKVVAERRLAALREERQRFVSLAENSHEFIGMCDMDFKPFYVNPAGMRLVGLEGLDQAMRTAVQDFFFPEDQAFIMEDFFPGVLRDGHREIEVRFRHFRTGEPLWMLYAVFRLTDAAGQSTGFATVSRDINERKRMDLALRETAAQLREADRRKDEFLATLAHELRNPLAPIRNSLELLRLSKGNAETAERARVVMERQLSQMVRLVDDLLDVSRISRGVISLRKSRIQVADVLRSAVETSQPLIQAAGHELTLAVPPEPVFVDADETRLSQVFSNLLNNAAKFTDRGGKIRLEASVEGDQAVVSVRDDGMGIPAPMLSRIFDMFTQVDPSLEKSRTGLGIGLHIARRLVELHGGTIEAKSAGRGTGTEIVVRLPVAPSSSPEERARAEGPGPGPGSARRILVVDDNQDAASSLAAMLRMMGHEVQVAHDGLEALRAGAAFEPDLMLLDIGMPKLDGHEVCRRLREEPWGRQVIVAALTGFGQEDDRRTSREAGFDVHLVKPLDPAALEGLLRMNTI